MAAASTLAGCSVMSDDRVDGWPILAVKEHFVAHAEMRDRCAPFVGFGSTPEACAVFDLKRGECHIFHSADLPPSEMVRMHELRHCLGYDHIGSTNMERLVRK